MSILWMGLMRYDSSVAECCCSGFRECRNAFNASLATTTMTERSYKVTITTNYAVVTIKSKIKTVLYTDHYMYTHYMFMSLCSCRVILL